MNDLFGNQVKTYTSRYKKVNPMVLKYGQIEGKKCKDCAYLIGHRPGQNSYWKCKLRGVTNGPATDHLVNWEACKKHEEEK